MGAAPGLRRLVGGTRQGPRGELLRWLCQLYTVPPDDPIDKQILIRKICRMASVHGPLEAEPFYLNSVGVLMRHVEAGTFWMGGGGGTPGTHRVTIPHDFYMGVFAVTQEQWRKAMGDNPSAYARSGLYEQEVVGISDLDLNGFPVEMVSWNDVQKCLETFNSREKNNGWIYRLPTEAEWEFSCRGGVTSPKECAFDFYFFDPRTQTQISTNRISSDQTNVDARKWPFFRAAGRFLGRTTQVGSYQPNRLGLYDMHGNVREWTDTAVGLGRINRGGSWGERGSMSAAADREEAMQDTCGNAVGFRFARVPVKASKELGPKQTSDAKK